MGFGASVIQRLIKTSVKKNLYYEIKEKVVEEERSEVRAHKRKRMVRVFGLDSTRDVRARLIEILYDRVAHHKDKFIAPIIYEEMSQMEVKRTGKVEHSDTSHDDQVFSYLMALYVWYDGHNVMENFNIQKNVIKTDENEDIEEIEGGIDSETDQMVELETNTTEDEINMIQEQLDYIKDSTKYKLAIMYNNEVYMQEQAELDMLMGSNRLFRQAYNEKYNIDTDEPGYSRTVMLPDELFLDDEEIMSREYSKNGNLFSFWDKV